MYSRNTYLFFLIYHGVIKYFYRLDSFFVGRPEGKTWLGAKYSLRIFQAAKFSAAKSPLCEIPSGETTSVSENSLCEMTYPIARLYF